MRSNKGKVALTLGSLKQLEMKGLINAKADQHKQEIQERIQRAFKYKVEKELKKKE